MLANLMELNGYTIQPEELDYTHMCKLRLYESILVLRDRDEWVCVWPSTIVYGNASGWYEVIK